MAKTLIVNLGPAGDVLRTTPVHRVITGEIHWLTQLRCNDLLGSSKISRRWMADNRRDMAEIRNVEFDRVINFNEEREAVDIVSGLRFKKLTGAYLEDGRVTYTHDSFKWFDMSLVSRHGKEVADRMKRENAVSVSQLYVEMAGGVWEGQEYDIGVEPVDSRKTKGVVGLINVVTGKWPNKLWYGYAELARYLDDDNYQVRFLGMRPGIREHIQDINGCETVVCGDTLGMHIAIALGKKVVGLFNCTPPQEIYDYGRLTKVVSPLLEKYMYDKGNHKEATQAINVDEVRDIVKRLMR